MKLTVILLILFFTNSYSVFDFTRRCLLYKNKCVSHCPRKMHPYHTRCDGQTLSQRTCNSPEIVVLGFTCGWSRCDCNSDLVLDEENGYCVDWSECTQKLPRRYHNKQDKDDFGRAKRVKISSRDHADLEYTGHCPMLKFRFGKCYGDNTRQILREIRTKGLFNKPLEYRPRENYELENIPRSDLPQRDVYDGIRNRPTAHMTGYTGYVPGMNFCYGKSYGQAADDCMANFSKRQREMTRKADFNKSYIRSRSAPKMETVHSRDEIRRDLSRFREINKYKENTISPEFPPIAGYTGHIPRIKGSEASLSQRYHCAAKRGLELIKLEKEKRKELQNADANVRAILKNHDKKYSYWNWG